MTEKERKYYHRIESTLIGQKVKQVYYKEINWEKDNSSFWEFSKDIHSVDMNIIFQLENGKLIQIMWDNEFYSYGVGLTILKKLEDEKEGFKTFNVSENPNWEKLIGKEISGIRILWSIINEYKKYQVIRTEKTITKLPQTWELSFNQDKVWIAALEINKNELDNYYLADHLSIFFSKKDEEKYNLCEKASL